MRKLDWHNYFINLAITVAQKSKDPSTHVGCVLIGPEKQVLSTGYNGFPRGVQEPPERWERPNKYNFVEHAERNAIYNAARHGIALRGATAYLNWEPHPCVECTKAFIQAGIVKIVGPNIKFPHNTDWKLDTSKIMLREANIQIVEVKL
jgi:dCMP deaminase